MNEFAPEVAEGTDGTVPWQRVKAQLRDNHGEDIYASWFERIELAGLDGGTAELSTPTTFIRHWTQTHYGAEILDRWRQIDPSVNAVRFTVRTALRPAARASASAPNQPASSTAAPAPHRVTDVGAAPANAIKGMEGSALEERYTFETLVEGNTNALAVAAAKTVAFATASDRPAYNPLYLCASVGLGKTHLLQAIAQAAAQSGNGRRVLYLTAEHFMYRFVSACRTKSTLTFKDVLRDIDILLVDDLQFLNGTKVHEEFGHTLTTLVDGGRQVVVAADRPPNELEGWEPRIRSRLGGGLLVELQAPDYGMRRKILEARIASHADKFGNLTVPEDVVDFVARSITTNGRDLDGAVTRLVANNQLTGTPINMTMAETVLRDLLRAREAKKPKIEDIQRVVCQHYNVTRQDLVSERRTQVVVRPRQIAMYLCKACTPRSLPEIGRRFGNRDHTTVLHAVRKVEKLIAESRQVAEDVETLKRLLDQ